MKQIPFNLRPRTAPGFADFHVSPGNAAAVTMLRARDRWPGPCLLLLGPSGSGKTHLGRAYAAGGEGVFLDDAAALPEETLFNTINQALASEIGGLVLATDTPPSAWGTEMPDLRSRLNAMPVITLVEHDETTLEPILREMFARTGRVVGADVVDYILRYSDRSVDALRALVHEVDVAAGSTKADVTKNFVSKYLKRRSKHDPLPIPSE